VLYNITSLNVIAHGAIYYTTTAVFPVSSFGGAEVVLRRTRPQIGP